MNEISILEKAIQKHDLSAQEAEWIMRQCMEGKIDPVIMGALLIALRMKGESVEEITSFVKIMREKAEKIPLNKEKIIDTCGTGGDHSGSFNISTTVAFILAGAGHAVAKHGNRSMTSKSGSSDVLEALGIIINISPTQVAKCINEVGIGFLFAPLFHSSMKHVSPVRQALKIRTAFNILGPLSNPATANIQLLGVFSKDLLLLMAQVLRHFGVTGYVVAGGNGMDELSLSNDNEVIRLRNNEEPEKFQISASEFGFKNASQDQLSGGSPQVNADITRAILMNQLPGPKTDIVLFNAAFALSAAENITPHEGLAKSREILHSGAAFKKLHLLQEYTADMSFHE